MGNPEDATVEVLLNLLMDERQMRLDTIESLDTKAGILLGFNGVLMAYAATLPTLLERFGLVALGLLSGAAALLAMIVRRLPFLEAQRTRDRYITKPAAQTRQVLLDTLTQNQTQIENRVKRKAGYIAVSTCTLGAGVLLMAIYAITLGG